MKPWDKMSSFRGANTLFQGQQNKGRSDREERSQKRDQRSDHRPDPRRSKDKGRRTRTAPRHNVRGADYIVKKDVVTTGEVVNKEV
jgi:hypothetical protein